MDVGSQNGEMVSSEVVSDHITVELDRAFVNVTDNLLHVAPYRRLDFNHFIRSIALSENDVFAAYRYGARTVLTTFYFVLYQYLSALNHTRHIYLDHVFMHHSVLRIMNDCAAGNYDSLYEMLFQ